MNSPFEQQMREVNEALLISSVHQHELTEWAQKAEAAIRESHARFEALFDASPIGMYLVDAELRIQLVSRSARPIFGGIKELIGSSFVDVIHILWSPESADDIVNHFRHTLQTGESYVSAGFSEERYDIKVREYYDWQINRIALPDGKYGVVCYFIDISARVLAEKSLRDSEVRYRRLFESAGDGILILDKTTGRITESNPYMVQMLGYSHDELVGKELWQIGLMKDEHESQALFRQLEGRTSFHYEHLPVVASGGRQVEVEIVGNVYLEGHEPMIQCNIRDTTERRQAERALARALAYADDIITTLREPFLVLDGDLRVRTANRSFYESFHVSRETTENCFVYELGNGQWDIPGLRKLLNEVLSHNQSVQNFEVEHKFPALGLKTMLLNARPFPPDSKYPELILLAVEDITAVRQRASELAAANRRTDEFLAMLSHELRNPLAPIVSAVQLLGLQKNEDRHHLQARTIIERQVGRLTRLIDDLMEVSRITTGRIHLQQVRLEVKGIVENAVESVRSQLDQHQHNLTLSLPSDPIWLYADPTRLEQVIVNLLANAIKYTDKGGQIWLTVQREAGECVLSVRDTGVGMAPELLPHIFDLFTQAERSLDRSQGGLGIGLALVQRIVEMHQGRVDVSSTLGKGSEFVVRLPLMTAPAMQRTPSQEEEDKSSKKACLRILVTDDNEDSAQALELLLVALGHDVVATYDGPSALKAAAEFHPHLVLLDIGLPGMNGYEVATTMRQQANFKNVVLVAVSGYGQDSDQQRSTEAGFDHYLIKPPDFNQLQKILTTVAEKARF